MQDPVGVEVVAPVQQLKHDALDRARRDRMTRILGVMVDDLEKVVLCVLEHHKDALILQNDLDEPDDVGIVELGAQSHLANSRLGDSGVLDLAFLVGLELLDGELAWLALAADGFVYSSICTTADEANHLILFHHLHFALVTDGPSALTGWICKKVSDLR